MRPECPPPEAVKEKIESEVRQILGEKADALIEAMKNKDESTSFREILAEQLSRREARQVGRAVHAILREGWECPEGAVIDGKSPVSCYCYHLGQRFMHLESRYYHPHFAMY